MNNSEMIPNRFKRICDARKKYKWIKSQIEEGKKIIVSTYFRGTVYDSLDQFKLDQKEMDVYVQSGKQWDCISFANIKSFK